MSATQSYPLLFVARATIEFETPFIIGGGEDDLFFDTVFVSDANGLPALPGSSLAGILRHAWADARHGGDNAIFGFQKGKDGNGSRLSVSWGCLHDSLNRPVEGIIIDQERLADPILTEAKLMTARDHVRINHKGTAVGMGKFDERSVSAGHRFTFELLLEGGENDRNNWDNILKLLKSDAIRIGGKTRRGYGQFRVVALSGDTFDLSNKENFKAFRALPVSLDMGTSLPDLLDTIKSTDVGAVTATLNLKPEAFWMIGGGFDDEVGLAPLKANRIVWEDGMGAVVYDKSIIPGSAMKGAVAHRVAFHYNRLMQRFVETVTEPEDVCGENNEAVQALFGLPKKTDKKTRIETGQRGRVIISDLFVEDPGEQKILNHVSIDRFTGGARTLEGALFDEKPYYGGPGFTVTVSVVEPGKISEAKIRQALHEALNDLAEGRLALGAGSGRGNGYFRATEGVQWNDAGKAWLAGGAA